MRVVRGTHPGYGSKPPPASSDAVLIVSRRSDGQSVSSVQHRPAEVGPVRSAPPRLAPVRFAPPRRAPVRFAPTRLAPVRFAPPRLAPVRSAPRGGPVRFAPPRRAPVRFAPPRRAPVRSAPPRLPVRFAPPRLAPVRFAPPRLAPVRFAPSRWAPVRFAPDRSMRGLPADRLVCATGYVPLKNLLSGGPDPLLLCPLLVLLQALLVPLPFLLGPLLVLGGGAVVGGSAVVGGRLDRSRSGWGVGHLEVGADDVDDGLPLTRVVLGEPFQGVEPGQPDRGLVAAELVGGLGVQLGHPPLGGVGDRVHGADLGGPLPPERQQQGERSPGTDGGTQTGPDGVDLHGSAGAGIGGRDAQQPPGKPATSERRPPPRRVAASSSRSAAAIAQPHADPGGVGTSCRHRRGRP